MARAGRRKGKGHGLEPWTPLSSPLIMIMICRVEARGKWHSGCAAGFLCFFALLFATLFGYAAGSRPVCQVLGYEHLHMEAVTRLDVVVDGRRRRRRKRRRLELGCVALRCVGVLWCPHGRRPRRFEPFRLFLRDDWGKCYLSAGSEIG